MPKIICPMFLGLVLSSAGFSQNYTIQTFAGGGPPLNLQAIPAYLGNVSGVAVDATGNIYFTLQKYSVAVRMSATTGAVALVAGTGTPGYGGDNGPATSAQLNYPTAITV